MAQVNIHGKAFREAISRDEINRVVHRLANRIDKHYPLSEDLVLIGVLNGAFIFMSDLVRAIHRPFEISFTHLKSYYGMESSGNVEVLKDIDVVIKNKHVIIVEDIIDTGNTLYQYHKILASQEPKSIAIYALLVKPGNIKFELPSFNVGFEIEDKFVVGYGLDFDGMGRNLNGIYQLVE